MMRLINHNHFKNLTLVLFSIVVLSVPSFLTAQTKRPIPRDQSLSPIPASKEVYSWARTAKKKLPDSRAWNKARVETDRQRSMLNLTRRGQSIIERACQAGEAMSAKEAADYDSQLRIVVEQMDKLAAAVNSTDPPKCFDGCDQVYPGWGHGQGWNRFCCKVACFKIEIHIGV